MQHQDDSKRLLLALALSAAVFLIWTVLFPPKPPETPPRPREVSEQVTEPGPGEEAPGEVPAKDGEEEPREPATQPEIRADAREEIVVDTGLARVVLINRGASPVSWSLTDYAGYENGERVDLVSRRAFEYGIFPFRVDTGDTEQNELLQSAFWVVEQKREEDTVRVTFRFADGRGLEAEKTYVFRTDSYLLDVSAGVKRDGRNLPISLQWGPGIANHPAELKKNRYFYPPAVFSGGNQFDRWKDPEDSPELRARTVSWAGIDDQYFAVLFLPPSPRQGFRYLDAALATAGEGEEASGQDEDPFPAPVLSVPMQSGGETISVYVGPKKLRILESMKGGDFTRIIEMGRYVGFIARFLLKVLIWIHETLITNYGWGIILLTFLIRLVFFPITQRSMRKMREMSEKMKRLQPQQKALKAKYKDVKDVRKRQKMNEELMALYKKEGINPADQLSGCLPMLLQMPIFFGFFRMLPASIELRKEPWILWIHDLSQPDPFYVTPLLMGAAFFFSTRRSMSQQSAQMEGFQKNIMMFMPIMFTIFCLWAPSGLVVYWLFSNVIQMGQQELLRRQTAGGDGNSSSQKGSGRSAGKGGNTGGGKRRRK